MLCAPFSILNEGLGMTLKTVHVPKEMEALFAKAEEVVSSYFKRQKSEPEKGTFEIFGERYIMVRAASLSVEFFDLVESILGKGRKDEAGDFARNILFDLAHAIGKADAKNLHTKMNLKRPIEKLSAGPLHFSHSGWAFVDIFPESSPSPDANYYLIYDHPFSFESDAWEQRGRKADFPVCIMNAGYSSGWCEESFGIELVASEILCKAKGDDCCRFIMAPPDRIEGHIEKYREVHPDLAGRVKEYEVHDFFKRQREADKRVNFLSSLVEQSSEGVAASDLDGNLTYVNKAFAEMHAYKPKEIVGKHISIFHSPDRMSEVEEANRRIDEAGEYVGEIWHVRADGTAFLAHMHNSLLRDDRGNPVGMVGTIRDLTERLLAEEALRESEEKLRLSFENAKDAIFWAEPETGIIINCNKAAEELLGKSRDEIVGQLQTTLHPPEEEERYSGIFKDDVQEGGREDIEGEIVRKSGERVPVHITASVTMIGDKGIIQGIFRDITERKRTEAQLKHYSVNLEHMVSERQKELDKARAGLFHSSKLAAMGRMGAGIAHQLNSPICSGLLFVDSLTEDFKNEPERVRILGNLRRSLIGMKAVIDAMLSMAMMPQRGKSTREKVDINDVLKRVLNMSRMECKKRNVKVGRLFDPEIPKLEARVGELDQVFINIINNAIDSMDKGGELTVSTARISGGLEIRIEDTGKGIAPENMEQIFEPFYTTRMAEKGVGLGLSIAREIIDGYGGEIRVESRPGEGSAFTISLSVNEGH